jgi:hypothetical protein
MTKCKQPNPDIIPGFDVLKWKREVQNRIYQETKDMTTDEFLEYLRRGSERFRAEQRIRRAERAAENQT